MLHPDLRVKRYIRSPEKDRKAYILSNVSGPNRVLQINDGSIETLNTALLERMYFRSVNGVYRQPPQIRFHVVFQKLAKFRSKVLRCFGERPTPVSPDDFVQMYKGRKRAIYSNALDRLSKRGLLRKHGYVNAFVKLEKVKEGKAPRCIQPRSPEYNISLGVYLKHIEHRLYNAIQYAIGSKTPIVAKGFNANEVGEIIHSKWDSFVKPVAIGLDATAFDQHVCAGMLKWEHSIYLELYRTCPSLPNLVKLLKWQIDNKGYGYCWDGTLKYSVKGRRFSGDMNTAMGNCLIMCGLVSAFCAGRFTHYDFVNNGDDCVVILEEKELKNFTGFGRFCDELGFVMKIEKPVKVLEQIDFCQQQPVWVNGSYRMVRHPVTAREKDSMSVLHHQNAESIRKWLMASGECGLALCSGIPIMQSMYKSYIREGLDSKIKFAMGMDTGAYFMSLGMECREVRVHPDTRVSFFLAFGYTPEEQVVLEKEYDGWSYDGTIKQVTSINDISTLAL